MTFTELCRISADPSTTRGQLADAFQAAINGSDKTASTVKTTAKKNKKIKNK